jgi:signal transduction histidine kinase
MTRLDAGVVSATSGQFSVADLFLRDRATLLEDARRERVSLVWRQSWYRLNGDIALASSLLYRLASNAIMHAGPQGRVLIAARRVHGGFRIEVRDNGPGIAAIHQQRIFEEFVQLQGETERREGYGLGLTIAARLAKILGTQVGLRSAPGKGSTFWFELQRVSTVDAGQPRRYPEPPAMHRAG